MAKARHHLAQKTTKWDVERADEWFSTPVWLTDWEQDLNSEDETGDQDKPLAIEDDNQEESERADLRCGDPRCECAASI